MLASASAASVAFGVRLVQGVRIEHHVRGEPLVEDVPDRRSRHP
jgi:hypothetical protein